MVNTNSLKNMNYLLKQYNILKNYKLAPKSNLLAIDSKGFFIYDYSIFQDNTFLLKIYELHSYFPFHRKNGFNMNFLDFYLDYYKHNNLVPNIQILKYITKSLKINQNDFDKIVELENTNVLEYLFMNPKTFLSINLDKKVVDTLINKNILIKLPVKKFFVKLNEDEKKNYFIFALETQNTSLLYFLYTIGYKIVNNNVLFRYINSLTTEILDYMIGMGMDLNTKDNVLEYGFIHFLVLRNKLEILKYILENYNIDINLGDYYSRTPLILSVITNNIPIFNLLIYYNSNINITDMNNRSAIHYCKQKNYFYKILKLKNNLPYKSYISPEIEYYQLI